MKLIKKMKPRPKAPSERTLIQIRTDYFDILKSHRKRYGVRGTILVPKMSIRQNHGKQYLFIMERICMNYPNLPMLFRMWDLNLREKDIVACQTNKRNSCKQRIDFLPPISHFKVSRNTRR